MSHSTSHPEYHLSREEEDLIASTIKDNHNNYDFEPNQLLHTNVAPNPSEYSATSFSFDVIDQYNDTNNHQHRQLPNTNNEHSSRIASPKTGRFQKCIQFCNLLLWWEFSQKQF